MPLDEVEDEIPSERGIEDEFLEQHLIEEALKKLSIKEREAILIQYFAGFTEHRMAFICQVTVDAIKERLKSARKKLRAFGKMES
jgi:DNA-directed RNA polymerase specialized sigma24 family protein